MADPDRDVERKIKEAILALRVGERYAGDEGKQRILEMYMNQVYYGNNAYGIWAAARRLLRQGHHLRRRRTTS